ncbi:unnamed protein product [Prorocentrum cordatum]|uniref:Uncharacterized protein n=1 Tax=Prorocentrum cordatum TaxID=2364126 RepID=A0ABN9XY82_9DINO|nr:unnamed protein product [Polarella glacialis]
MRVRCLRGRGDAHERGALLMSVLSVLSRSRCRGARPWTCDPTGATRAGHPLAKPPRSVMLEESSPRGRGYGCVPRPQVACGETRTRCLLTELTKGWVVAWTTEPSFGAGVSFTISSRAGIADADFLVLPPSASNSLSVFSCIVCVLQSCLHRRGFRRGAVRARESFRCWKLTAGVIRIAIRKVIFGGRLTSSSTA